MDLINRVISELIPAEYNPRQLSEKQFRDLQNSFKRLGTLEPAVINTNSERLNIIISGHQRIKVAESLGMTEYPCYHVDFTTAKEKEANIRMNKNTGDWDMDALANNFEVEDLKDWGFDKLLFPDFENDVIPDFSDSEGEKKTASITFLIKDSSLISEELNAIKSKYDGFNFYGV